MKSLREVIEEIWKDHFCAWDIKHKGGETGRVCELYRHKKSKICVKSVEGHEKIH